MFLKRTRIAILALALVCLVLAVLPTYVFAERVGVLITNGSDYYETIHKYFLSHLEKKGYANRLEFITQRPYADPVALGNASRKLIVADVDFIITYGTQATLAIQRERPRTPVLYTAIYEPLLKNIKKKRTTGVCSKYQVSSLMRYLRASARIKKLVVLYSSHEAESSYQLNEIKTIAQKYGYDLTPVDITSRTRIPRIMSELQADALIITSSDNISASMKSIIKIATNRKIPVASFILHSEVYAMITLSADPQEQGMLLAGVVADMLDIGGTESVAPVCSRKIELVFNVKDATRMGLRMPMDLITEATRLINK